MLGRKEIYELLDIDIGEDTSLEELFKNPTMYILSERELNKINSLIYLIKESRLYFDDR